MDSHQSMCPDSECSYLVAPPVWRPCNVSQLTNSTSVNQNRSLELSPRKCSTRWKTAKWDHCDAWCGIGKQRRLVYCVREHIHQQAAIMSDYLCKKHSMKPTAVRMCQVHSCYSWRLKKFSNCSVTCGKGHETSEHECLFSYSTENKTVVKGEQCEDAGMLKPANIRRPCSRRACPKPFWFAVSWQPSPANVEGQPQYLKNYWMRTKCSATCGEGMTKRLLTCAVRMPGGSIWPAQSPTMCRGIPRPPETEKCNLFPCPKWVQDAWTKCNGTKEFGYQIRPITCRSVSNTILSRKACDSVSKPPELIRKCLLEEIPGSWFPGPWSDCSMECGFGYQKRHVTCRLTNGSETLNTDLCPDEKPPIMKECYIRSCSTKKYWMAFDKYPCSSNGTEPGYMERVVFCVERYAVHRNQECASMWKPSQRIICYKKNRYYWITGEWEKCPDNCEGAVVNRQVECRDLLGQKHPDWHCHASSQPLQMKLCTTKCDGYPRTCKEAKEMYNKSNDDEYQLNIQHNLIRIYCRVMSSANPIAYVTLPRPNHSSSSMYLLPKSEQGSCPAKTGQVNKINCPTCDIDQRLFAYTSFWRIRINLTDMRVDLTDFTYSYTYGISRIPYATAKDCFGSLKCPQGEFKIDLRDTGFAISKETAWKIPGRDTEPVIELKHYNQILIGHCGGQCEGCIPTPGLFLEPNNYRLLKATSSASRISAIAKLRSYRSTRSHRI